MPFVADFHIHSRYSRATSKNLTLEELDRVAAEKGVAVLGTGDFTHPLWFAELERELEEAEPGLYRRKGSPYGTRFLLTCEVASIYSKGGAVRRVHTLLFAPSLEVARAINKQLNQVGNLKSDGRPILGLDVAELARITLAVDERCMVIPAHAWTPWFSVFGSKSGFNSLEEAFGDMAPHIFAIETGLSSDPAMNWRVGALDDIALISNSDCHSSAKIAREANVFACEMSYEAIRDTLKTKDPKRFVETLEFFPEEGKYHYDGHRACNIRQKPASTRRLRRGGPIGPGAQECPACGRPLTVGVLSRVEELATRPEGEKPGNAIPFRNIIPLEELIAATYGNGVGTKRVAKTYAALIAEFGTMLAVILDIPIEDIARVAGWGVAEAVRRMREGSVYIEPGYDGEYGTISVFTAEERAEFNETQQHLF